MKVKDIAKTLNMKELTNAGCENEVKTVYTGDLLSRVMADCQEGSAWITVQTHMNVIAVAELNDVACVIIPHGIPVEESSLKKANLQGLCMLSSDMDAYELCWRIHELLL